MPISSHQDSIRLQDRDVALLRGLFESRALTLSHATTLYFEGKAEPAKKRVQKLKSAGLIRERPRRLYEKSVLFLTTKGFNLLKEDALLDGFPRIGLAAFEKRSRISELTLRHELQVQDVKVAILKVLGAAVKEFTTWPLLSQFAASPGTGPSVDVKPDGFIRIHESDTSGNVFESAFFFELDRSTETLETLASRARCYLNYYQDGGFAKRNGRPPSEYKKFPFRVLIVFKTAERRNNMAAQLLAGRPQILTHSWLTTFAEVIADPLGPIWVQPRDYLAIERDYFLLRNAHDTRTYRRQSEQDKMIEKKIKKHRLLAQDGM